MNYFSTKNLHLLFMLKNLYTNRKTTIHSICLCKMAVEDQNGIILWMWQMAVEEE